MKEKLIREEEIQNSHRLLRGRFGKWLAKLILNVTGANKVNMVYDESKHQTGVGFVTDLLDRRGIIRIIENYEILDSFQEDQAFITVSNHPFGHIDGIIAISVVAAKRKDFKMMVNWMLNRIDTMEENFIGVNPYSKDSKMSNIKSSVGGVKSCLEHLRDGHPLGFFPAGGVSTSHLTHTEDREWQVPVLKLIKKAKVPVVPMYISGTNSWIYRFMGFIDWRFRMLRLLHEVTNKKGKKVYIRLGNPISVEEQSQYEDIQAFGEFLKSQTYALQTEKSPGVF